MAWKDTLQTASYRGVEFDVLSVNDQLEWSVAEHQIAYQDGADVELLGKQADKTHVSAIFFGADYEVRLKNFLRALHADGPGELIHPIFGTRRVAPRQVKIGHAAELVDGCLLEITFVAAILNQPLFSIVNATAAADAAWQGAQQVDDVTLMVWSEALPAILDGAPDLAALGQIVGFLADQLSTLLAHIGADPRALTSLGDSPDTVPAAWLADLRTLYAATAELATAPPAQTNPASTSAAVASSTPAAPSLAAWRAIASSTGAALARPAITTATDSGADWRSAASSANPASASAVMRATTLARTVEIIIATAHLARTAATILADEAQNTPTLSPPEIELIANHARSQIASTLEHISTCLPRERNLAESLRQTALSIQQAAIAAINQRPPLLVRLVPFNGNLSLIAHRWYGDWTRCTELARLNPQLTQPNFIRAGELLHAYAQ